MFKYKIGTVVRERGALSRGMHIGKDAQPMYGHVIGFDQVELENGHDTILKIAFSDGSERSRHPSYVITEEELRDGRRPYV